MMKARKIRSVKGPEAKIQTDIIRFLEDRKWYVRSTHGNVYSSGWPDLYACRRRFHCGVPAEGIHYSNEPLVRWIEVKHAKKYRFTGAQLSDFPKFTSQGVGIWVLTAATEAEYAKLFRPPNWYQYLPVAQA